MDNKEIWNIFKDYCAVQQATIKVLGDYSYKSKNYYQKTNEGRYIQLKSIKNNKIVIWDNKKGVIELGG